MFVSLCVCVFQEERRPSRVSAVFRTTVLEGETLVMRKLVVSGIVAAEKTYLTWLTILKEVSQHSQSFSYVRTYYTFAHTYVQYVPMYMLMYVYAYVRMRPH